jgi:hypothetical protein
MSEALVLRPHLDWYRKSAKKKLREIRKKDASARLAQAQLAVARQAGFSSWRKLCDSSRGSISSERTSVDRQIAGSFDRRADGGGGAQSHGIY